MAEVSNTGHGQWVEIEFKDPSLINPIIDNGYLSHLSGDKNECSNVYGDCGK